MVPARPLRLDGLPPRTVLSSLRPIRDVGTGVTEQPLDRLRSYMKKAPAGAVKSSDVPKVVSLLAECWSDLAGPFEGGMADYKLHGRTEGLSWNPTELSFTIERHGAVVMGSVYAELQNWVVDVVKGSARRQTGGKRVIGQKAKPLKVGPLVEDVIELIRARADDPQLKWQNPDRVRVMIGQIIPGDSAAKQTLKGRRIRFSLELETQMRAIGWEKVHGTAPHTYSRDK